MRDDDPGLGLAVRQAEPLAREGIVRMHVHGQPLAGVEQLDEQLRVGASPGGVIGPEEALTGSAADGVAQQAPVG